MCDDILCIMNSNIDGVMVGNKGYYYVRAKDEDGNDEMFRFDDVESALAFIKKEGL